LLHELNWVPATAPTEDPTSLPSNEPLGQSAMMCNMQVEIDLAQFHEMLPRDEI